MNPTSLENFLNTDEEVRPHINYLNGITKPSVDISISSSEASTHESKFGGQPAVPKDFVWPTHEEGEYRFLGQINFSEIENCPTELPKTGILSLFYAYDEEGEIFWGDDGYVLGFYWQDVDNLVLLKDAPAQFHANKIHLQGGIELPRHKDLRQDWPLETEFLYDFSDLDGYCNDYMLGYPSFCTLGYDPTPGDKWISLLTLSSYDKFDWCWHDGNKLMIFIEESKLAQADFSFLKTDAG